MIYKKSLYFASKPIQYFNITNIEDSNLKDLIIISYFKDANILAKRAIDTGYWNSVKVFMDYKSAFSSVVDEIYDNIFIDSDYGFSKFNFLGKFKNSIISVYEEGIGTYSNNLRHNINLNLKKNSILSRVKSFCVSRCYSLLGHKDYHGGCKFTDQVIVYDPKSYIKGKKLVSKKTLTFKRSFREHLNTSLTAQVLYPNPINFENLQDKKVVIYLSQWEIDKNIDRYLKINYSDSYIIIKPHPHNSNYNLNDLINNSVFDQVLPGEIMIEYVINGLITHSKELVIIHHGTSALMNFNFYDFKQVVI